MSCGTFHTLSLPYLPGVSEAKGSEMVALPNGLSPSSSVMCGSEAPRDHQLGPGALDSVTVINEPLICSVSGSQRGASADVWRHFGCHDLGVG